MPKVEIGEFGRKTRIDGKFGYRIITPTTMAFLELDGSDIRMSRVRVFLPNGVLEHTYLLSPMGQRYLNMDEYPDDIEYLEKLTG